MPKKDRDFPNSGFGTHLDGGEYHLMYCEGATPVISLNIRLKVVLELKPESMAIPAGGATMEFKAGWAVQKAGELKQ